MVDSAFDEEMVEVDENDYEALLRDSRGVAAPVLKDD